jgi:SAM-dependent methyltransferase
MDARAWDERYAGAELVWSVEPNQFVARECADLPPGRALDLACGEGRNAIWLARRGWDVTAVDFSAVAIDKARRLAADADDTEVTWVVGDATSWPGAADQDLVVVAYLQLSAAERTAAVRAAYDSLAPGGTLVWVAHDSTNLTEGTGGPQDPSVLMTADDVLANLTGAELEVLRAERVERLVGGDDDHRGESSRTAYDCLVRVRRP